MTAPSPRDRTMAMALVVNCEAMGAGAVDKLAYALAAARAEAFEEAAKVAELFTVKPDASIYPDVPFAKMGTTAQFAAHTTAQQIAAAIRALAQETGE